MRGCDLKENMAKIVLYASNQQMSFDASTEIKAEFERFLVVAIHTAFYQPRVESHNSSNNDG
jgi:hypothetical protein